MNLKMHESKLNRIEKRYAAYVLRLLLDTEKDGQEKSDKTFELWTYRKIE